MVITYGIEWTDQAVVLNNALAQRLHNLFATNVLPIMAGGYRLQHTEVRFGVAAGGTPTIGFYAQMIQGGSGVAMLPQNCAFLVKKLTAFAGRRNRGRFFLPSVHEGAVDAVGNLDQTLIDNLQGKVNSWLGALIADVDIAGMAILHSIPLAGATPPPTPVIQLTVDRKIATQRRRLR
jgi:hypothetical protein